MQNKKKGNQAIVILSITCLLLTIIPAFLVFMGLISSDLNKTLMLIGTIGWFITAPFWLNPKKEDEASA